VKKQNLKILFKKRGIRVTPQRLAVFEALINNQNHPSAEEIYEIVKKTYENISKSTVYQILHLLEELGIITQIEIDGVQRYEHQLEFHIHAICPKCNEIEDLSSNKIKEFWDLTMEELKIKPINQEIKVFRYCGNCEN